jgi:hypothetical protein
MKNCYTKLRPLSKNYNVLKAGFCFRYQVKKRGRETGNSSVAPLVELASDLRFCPLPPF